MSSGKKFNFKYWDYLNCQNLATLTNKTFENFKPKSRFYDDCFSLYELLTISPHPSLKYQVGKDSIDPSSLVFSNVMIDINTLKILVFLLPFTKINELKFSCNSFEYSNLEFLINSLLEKNNNVFNLYIEWNNDIRIDSKLIKSPETAFCDNSLKTNSYSNSMISSNNFYANNNVKEINKLDFDNIGNELNKENFNSINKIADINKKTINNTKVEPYLLKSKIIIAKLGLHQRLNTLCLRGNYLGDEAVISLLENLRDNQVLRNLNLYKNSITSKSTNTLKKLFEFNRKIEDINLGSNYLKNNDFIVLSSELGKHPLNSEEIENYNRLLKERNDIIEKNKKLKASKKNEIQIPNLQEIEILGNCYYSFKNNVLKTINLMQNEFNKDIFEYIVNSIEKTEDVLYIFDFKLFAKNERDKLNKIKSSSKVYFAK